ncbi:MAG: hypothetical protein ACE5IY_06460 [bacterium]
MSLILLVVVVQMDSPLGAQPNRLGADNKTFEERRDEWLARVPSPSSSIEMIDRRNYLFSWLDTGVYNGTVSETIDHFIHAYWLDDIRAQHGYAVMIPLKYGSKGTGVISSGDESNVKSKYEQWISSSSTFGDLNPNKQVFAMVGVYLYTSEYDKDLEFPIYGYSTSVNKPVPKFYRNHWPSFRYNGHSYKFGRGPYNARQLAKDWLEQVMDGWYVRKSSPRGNREFDSIVYSRAYPGAMALLADLADDPKLRRKAKMCADLSHLDSVLDFSANAWGGTMGRNDYRKNSRPPIYPFHHYWGMGDKLDGDEEKWNVTVNYHVDYDLPDVIIDAGVLEDEPEDYWHFHKEYNEGLLNREGKGKWNWVTRFYTLGSNVGQARQGWQLSVKGKGRTGFIRLWVNERANKPAPDQETNYLGLRGCQFRNALFADIRSGPNLWEQTNDASWDIRESDGTWQFRKLGRIMVAVGMGTSSASVEVAIAGLDYPGWAEFKNAIKHNAILTEDSYTTSRGVKIGKKDFCGLMVPGDCDFPFPRMETIDHKGRKIVTWKNNVMAVSRHGKTRIYNFNNWTVSDDGGEVDLTSPLPPSGIKASRN